MERGGADPLPYEYGASCSQTDAIDKAICRMEATRRTFSAATVRQDQVLQARNTVFFAGGMTLLSTLFLNPSGLNGSQTEDMSELALGLAILQASDSVYSPLERRTAYERANGVADCYLGHLQLAESRQARITRISSLLNALEPQVQLASSIAEDRRATFTATLREQTARDVPDEDAISEAAEGLLATEAAEPFIANANSIIDRARVQINAFDHLQTKAARAHIDLANAVRTQLHTESVDLNQLIQTTSEAAQALSDFTVSSGETRPEAPAAAPGEEEFKDAGNRSVAFANLQNLISELHRQTPNITTLSASMDQCVGIMQTGLEVALPALNDAAPPARNDS
jgi:hypothetical protein